MTFVQLIECRTSRPDEMNRLMDDWAARARGRRTATHTLVGRDRSDAAHLVEVVEFPSYEDAVRGSGRPESDRVLREMAALCDETPVLMDLDVVRADRPAEDTVRRFFTTLTAPGELAPLNDLLAEDVHSHDPVNPQDTLGLDHARAEYRMWRSAFDGAFTVEDVLVQDDRACARWTWRATHKGDFLGIPATGRDVAMTGATVFRLAPDGRITETWWQRDHLGLMQQLGALDELEN
ncbi:MULTISPECIES: ester cyclase [unclassified Streptomyces]|uniref:ester cyclase n=1 Tax=unclassified Streptomyces TaxID=2593676 RepID=UPI0013164C87|nr:MULTISPECIES: ester cyclase [unclassified Streptomyces]QHC30951.1 ester cyclase [Streptomyces sp. HF10]WKE70144.1 ester cyclase [Streptomyces sp. WP-1]